MKSSVKQSPLMINLVDCQSTCVDDGFQSSPQAGTTASLAAAVNGRRQLTLHWETIPDAVIIAGRDGSVVDMNLPSARLMGIDIADAPLRNVMTFLPGLTSSVIKQIQMALQNGRSVLLQGVIQTVAGEQVPAEVSVSLGGAQGEELCFILRDIRHHRQTEAALLQMQGRIARAERLETAGTVSGQIAHDFNNLLTPLLAYPSLIRRELNDDSPAQEYLNVLEKTAEDMAHMTQQLLALSRRGNVGEDVFNPNAIVKHVTTLLRNECLPTNIMIKNDLSDDLLPVRGGGDQMLRVVQNLCQNAVDAMESGGTLKVHTENVYLDTPVGRYDTVEPGEYVRLSISDTGPGIPEEMREKVFEPFFTTKRGNKRRGSGLGLSIVHGIIKDHHGYVDLESQAGKGTTFFLYLPVFRTDDVASPSDSGFQGQGQKIMVVDDDPNQLRIIVKLLGTLNYDACGVEVGEEALERLRLDPDCCDMVILDMCLGQSMDGCDVWIEIAKIKTGMPSLLVSGFSSPEPRVKLAQRHGAGAYIKKPLTIEKLGRALSQALDRSRQPESAVPTPEPDSDAPVRGRVLLVDDEEQIRRMFSMILSSELPDLEICQAGNGKQAVELFRQKPFDLILMDLHMPIMDGRQAFIELRDHCEAAGIRMPSVIFCTGFALPEFLKEIVSSGGGHVLLRKPVSADVLVKTVQYRLLANPS